MLEKNINEPLYAIKYENIKMKLQTKLLESGDSKYKSGQLCSHQCQNKGNPLKPPKYVE
jgi:hypothetical protein